MLLWLLTEGFDYHSLTAAVSASGLCSAMLPSTIKFEFIEITLSQGIMTFSYR